MGIVINVGRPARIDAAGTSTKNLLHNDNIITASNSKNQQKQLMEKRKKTKTQQQL